MVLLAHAECGLGAPSTGARLVDEFRQNLLLTFRQLARVNLRSRDGLVALLLGSGIEQGHVYTSLRRCCRVTYTGLCTSKLMTDTDPPLTINATPGGGEVRSCRLADWR